VTCHRHQGIRGRHDDAHASDTFRDLHGKRSLEIMNFKGPSPSAIRRRQTGRAAIGQRLRQRQRALDGRLIDPHTGERSISRSVQAGNARGAQTGPDCHRTAQLYLQHCRSNRRVGILMQRNGELMVEAEGKASRAFRLFERNTEAKVKELTK